MSFFSSVKGPEVLEVRRTFTNMCAIITQDDKYKEGVDADGIAALLNDVYYYVTGNRNQRIRLPAPVNDPHDKFRVMWPEGAKVSSRAPSTTSSKVPSLAKSYTQKDVNRASSVVSSSIASKHRYIPFASEDDDTEAEQSTKQRKSRVNAKRHNTKHNNEQENPLSFKSRQKQREGGNTVKINSEPLVHSSSIEAIRAARDNDINDDEEEGVPPLTSRPPASRKVYKGPAFADD